MGHSASKSGVVIWGPTDCEDLGYDGGSPRSSGIASAGVSTAGSAPLASGSVPTSLQLRLVEGLKAAAVRSVSAGGKHFACLAQTGELYMWGAGAQGQLGLGDLLDVVAPKILRPVQSKAVQTHTACVLQDGSAYTWGCALHGRLGLADLKLPRGGAVLGGGGVDSAQLVVPAPRHVRALEKQRVTHVSCGAFHTAFLAVTEAGTSLHTCGLGLSGRLGLGDEEDRHVPEKVHELEGLTITDVACGGHHTACITSTGCLYTWGGAAFGKLGLDGRVSVRKPTKVEGPLVGKLGHEESGEADEPLPRQLKLLPPHLRLLVTATRAVRPMRRLLFAHCGGKAFRISLAEARVPSLFAMPGMSPRSLILMETSCPQRSRQQQIHEQMPSMYHRVSTWVDRDRRQLHLLLQRLRKRRTLGEAQQFVLKHGGADCTQGGGEVSAELQIAQLSRELQAARVDSLLLATLLKGAATESSADAGDRLATLRGHYEQHIKELGQQLAQQDVQFHAALAARSCSAVSSGSHGTVSAACASIAQRFSLEEALADPLGSQRPSSFTLPTREDGSSPGSDGASSTRVAFDSVRSPSGHPKGEGKPNKALLLHSKSTEPLMLPLACASAPAAKSSAMRQQQEHADPSRRAGEDPARTLDGGAALKGASATPVIPIFVLEDNENPWS
ncbi:hypothetical protein ACSSS7_000603 [Eimeria intestinalis]